MDFWLELSSRGKRQRKALLRIALKTSLISLLKLMIMDLRQSFGGWKSPESSQVSSFGWDVYLFAIAEKMVEWKATIWCEMFFGSEVCVKLRMLIYWR
jgi:hypothetical protein